MARSDLIYALIESGLTGDEAGFRQAAEAISVEERVKQHVIMAHKIDALLKMPQKPFQPLGKPRFAQKEEIPFAQERIPERRMEDLFLSETVQQTCKELVEEQTRADLLRSYGVEPRHKVLLIGPPGNGKTSLAEAIATALTFPFYVVKYESIVGAYLGETASRLAKLFEFVRTKPCVLFFDEFDTLGKERGDVHETGEIKRVVSSLLLQLDALPSYCVLIAATNHAPLLDQAAWRRFQIRLNLDKPGERELEQLFSRFEQKAKFHFGVEPDTLAKKMAGKSYAEAEEFALAVYRRYILQTPVDDTKSITLSQLERQKSAWQNTTT